MAEKTSILVAGAGGRMGKTIAAVTLADEALEIGAAFDRNGANSIGEDLGELSGAKKCGVQIEIIDEAIKNLSAKCSVLIDFTMPAASIYHAGLCADHGIAHVIGTTGFSSAEEAILAEKAKKIPVVKAGNMSTGITLLSVLVERAAASLAEDFDIEINEAHHRYKVDAPSGTALLLGEAAASGRNVSLQDKTVGVREGITGARKSGDIGFSVVRGGGIIGEHSVMFASEGETLTLSHNAVDRKLFAEGALRAAKWLSQNGTQLRQPGLYSMRDVLGL